MSDYQPKDVSLVVTCSNINIKIEDVKFCKLSRDLKNVAVVMKDGMQIISSVGVHQMPIPLRALEWHAHGEANKFIGITDDNSVISCTLVSVTKPLYRNEITTKICSGIEQLHNVMNTECHFDLSLMRLLDYRKDIATFYINNSIVRFHCDPNGNPTWKLDFKIVDRGALCKDGVHICNAYIFVIWNARIIDVYDFARGNLKVSIDLNICSGDISLSSASFDDASRFLVSSDCEYLLHLQQNGQIDKINLITWLSNIEIDRPQSFRTESGFLSRLWNRKQLSRLTGFNKDDTSRDCSKHIILTNLCYTCGSNFVKALRETTSEIIIWEQDELFGRIIAFNYETTTSKLILRLIKPSFVIFSENTNTPNLILCENKMMALINAETPECVISKLIAQEAAFSAAHLAKLNNWKLTFISPNVLASCLKGRHLEAISYYLKNQEFDIDTVVKFTSNEISHIQQVLLILKSSIKECLTDQPSLSFGAQVLKVFLEYLMRMLKTAVLANNDVLSNLIMDNLNDFRSILEDFPKSVDLPTDATSEVSQYWKEWLQLDKLNIIRNGLQNKCFPLVQSFFLHNSLESFNYFVDESPLSGLQSVIELINNDDVDNAVRVLQETGYDVDERLKHIYFHTSNRRLKKTLEDWDNISFSENDLQLIARFKALEERYPCQSIITSLEMTSNLKSWGSDELLYVNAIFDPSKNSDGSNMSNEITVNAGNETACVTVNYNCGVLNWTKDWNQDIWGKIIFESLINNPDTSYSEFINSKLVWRYLLLHNRIDIIKSWLGDVMMSESENNFYFESFLNRTLSQEMIEEVTSLVPHVGSSLLDEFARFGVLSSNELKTFTAIIKRLGRRLKYPKQISNILEMSSSSLTPKDFHTQFITYCLNQNLPTILWHHLEQFSIPMEFLYSLNMDLPLSWLNIIIRYKHWAENPTDCESVYLASISNGEYVLQSMISTDEILKYGLVGLTTLLYQPKHLRSIIQSNIGDMKSDIFLSSGVSIDDWNFLRRVMSSFTNEGEQIIQDVTVYDLLKENLPLDVSRLFCWQNTNNLRTSDGFTDLPYFSNVELVKKFGYTQDLDFTYYLRQGRPCFAYVKFITCCAIKDAKISRSQVNWACNVAHGFAIKNIYLPSVTSSCVGFMELLNCNTQGLRIDLEILQLILYDHNKEENITKQESQFIDAETYSQCELALLLEGGIYGDTEKLQFILNWAEEIMRKNSATNEMNATEAFARWSLLNLFCQSHGLTNSVAYLEICAKSGNWILFLIFAEIFQYSRDEVWQIIIRHGCGTMGKHFTNSLCQLRNHSQSSVQKIIQFTADVSKNARANLYSKMGLDTSAKVVRQNSDDMIDSNPGESSEDTTDRSSSSSSLNGAEVMFKPFKETISPDVLLILLQSHLKSCPWKVLLSLSIEYHNPALAILAACYQESSHLECLCIWFLATVEGQAKSCIHQLLKDCIANQSWEITNLLDIIRCLIKCELIDVLTEGFYYFMPDFPLYNFLMFLKQFLVEKAFQSSTVYLNGFQSHLCYLNTAECSFSSSAELLENFCVEIINDVVISIKNRCERIAFLSTLSTIQLIKGSPNYSLILQLEQLFSTTCYDYNFQNLLNPNFDRNYTEECRKILNFLVEEKHFIVANEFVTLVGYPKYEILLAEANSEITSRLCFNSESSLNTKYLIWKQYYTRFKECGVPATEAFAFFKKFRYMVEDSRERYLLLRFAWLTHTWEDQEVIWDQEIEAEMWLSRIKAEVEYENTALDLPVTLFELPAQSNSPQMWTSQQIYDMNSRNPISMVVELKTVKEKAAFEKIVGNLLDQGNVDVAYRLMLLFDQKCPSLSVILICMQLAEGSIMEDDIDKLLKEPSKLCELVDQSVMNKGSPVHSIASDRDTKLSHQLSVGSSSSSSGSKEVIKLMKRFLNKCEMGALAVSRVVTFYKIAMTLKENYEVVITWSYQKLLEAVLQCDYVNRITLVKDLITTTSLDDSVVVPFLCNYITTELSTFAEKSVDDENNTQSCEEIITDPAEMSVVFLQLAKLCEDVSSLGKLLLDKVTFQSNKKLDVELCINAHNCYSTSCHVDGIIKALETAKELTRHLASAEEYSLMVRLLTGIGRFSEMHYIFDLLRNHHRFELLFKKGMEKVPGFKLAVLDYMKRFHPYDMEMFTMIALHFRMYREIAETLESLAKHQLDLFSFEYPAGVRDMLDIISQYFADAAESYVKAECLQHALICVKQAELVALQIYLLPSGARVLNLKPPEVTQYIASNVSFNEAYIVAEAYENHQSWALALYNNYILKNVENYFAEFSNRIGLPVPIIEEVVRRYTNEPIKSGKMALNMRHLLNLVDDVRVKYNLANELGFNDFSMSMLTDQHIVYLQKMNSSL